MRSDFERVTRSVCGHLEIEVVLPRVVRALADNVPIASAYIETYDASLRAMRINWAADAERGWHVGRVVRLPEFAASVIENIAATDPMVINDVASHPIARCISAAMDEADRAQLVMPLGFEGTAIAVLVLVAPPGATFEATHAEHLHDVHDPIAIAVSNALRFAALQANETRLEALNRDLRVEAFRPTESLLIGQDGGLKPTLALARAVAGTRSPVLLLGETGVGKERLADFIHETSPRAGGPIVKINCGAIPQGLVDSELFGHERGAFTGAIGLRAGRFEQASGGTLFLDEIGELPPPAQVRLLRALQTQVVHPVGSERSIPVDVRVVCATHRDLEAMVARGSFREDLWFRINVFPITIPPLRERTRDIPKLVQHLVRSKCEELMVFPPPSLEASQLQVLTEYLWPGNIRELANLVERALIVHRDGPLVVMDPGLPSRGARPTAVPTLDEVQVDHIQRVLRDCNGRVSGPRGAAARLGIKPTTLRSRMKKLGVEVSTKIERVSAGAEE